MSSKEKVLMILRQSNEQVKQMDEKEFKNMLMRMPCKRDSEKAAIELYLLSTALEEMIKAVEGMQEKIDIRSKLKNGYEGVNMIVGLRRDTAMMKDGLERVKEKIERG